jgi:hypothetical protein
VTYKFRLGPEFLWFVLTAVVTTLMQVFVTFEPSEIADWRLWLVSLGAAAVRAAAGAVLAWVGQQSIGGEG